MSATQELLTESLKVLNAKIADAENLGVDTTSLVEEKNSLLKKLSQINTMLNENSSLLKG